MADQGIEKIVKIPEEVSIVLEGTRVKVEGPNGTLSKDFRLAEVGIEKDGDRIVVKTESDRRKKKATLGTVTSHIRNMIQGVTEGFAGKLKIVYSHFPISVNVNDKEVRIENFIGEEDPRIAKIVGDTEVKVQGEEIEVIGVNKEEVGQTVANIEQTSRVKNRDPRVFQDGIYSVERP